MRNYAMKIDGIKVHQYSVRAFNSLCGGGRAVKILSADGTGELVFGPFESDEADRFVDAVKNKLHDGGDYGTSGIMTKAGIRLTLRRVA
jgi:hypothetical protein